MGAAPSAPSEEGVTGGQALGEPSSSFLGGLGKKLGDLLPFGKTSSTVNNNKEHTVEEGSESAPQSGGRRRSRKNRKLSHRSTSRMRKTKQTHRRNK